MEESVGRFFTFVTAGVLPSEELRKTVLLNGTMKRASLGSVDSAALPEEVLANLPSGRFFSGLVAAYEVITFISDVRDWVVAVRGLTRLIQEPSTEDYLALIRYVFGYTPKDFLTDERELIGYIATIRQWMSQETA